MFRTLDVEQNSEEWFKARGPLITASEFSKVTTPAKCKRSTSLETLINKKVAFLLTGKLEDTFQSEAMKHGNETEDEALEFINFTRDLNFEKIGFLESMEVPCGGSPDAINLEDRIGLEIKCPQPSTHVGYLLKNELPTTYFSQVQGLMMITGFDRWVFVSYCDGMSPLYLVCKRDETYINALRQDLIYAGAEIQKRYEKLKGQL